MLGFSGFYLFLYLGRFNFWPMAPLIKEQLNLSHVEIGLITALLLWGFGLGELFHGRLSEAYGLRLWILLGACLTAVFNLITSFGSTVLMLAIPWGINGFVNAACASPGISLISQWWPRRHRGKAMGIYSVFAAGAMLLMWLVTGWVAGEFGWRAGFRYPPLIIPVLGIILYLMVRDRPSDAGLPEYIEEDPVSANAEMVDPESLRGFGPYKHLLTNPQFLLTCHVHGLSQLARYGLTIWVPLYYFEKAGLDITSTVLVTLALPIGRLPAPLIAGVISDNFLSSARRPLVLVSCGVSALALIAIALAPATNLYLAVTLMFIAGFAMSMSPLAALVVDISGRQMAGTATGLMDAHGYLYAGTQAVVFSILLDMTGSPWPLVFLSLAGVRVLTGVMIAFVKA